MGEHELVEMLEEMGILLGTARKETEQALDGKKVAFGRARKALQEIKKLAQDVRVGLQDLKNSQTK